MTLCPHCGEAAQLMARAGGMDFWRCEGKCSGKLFTRPAQTTSGSANGRSCLEASGEIINAVKL